MTRRDFIKTVAAGAVGAASARAFAAQADGPATFMLSSDGCSRATGYAETNKIVTLGNKTHVAWLDSAEGQGFRVRVRTLDRTTGEWSPTFDVGPAHDNHGGPALAPDSKGYLHIVYFPHHHPFRYRRSKQPNDATAWGDEVQFGKRCTYPTLMVGPDDTLYLTCRESNRKGKPWRVNLYTKKPDGDWQGPSAILVADEGGYSHFQEALAWGPDHTTLHLSTRMYGGKPGRPHTVGYMHSPDFGKTWLNAKGERLELPVTSDTISVLAQNKSKRGRGYRCGSIAVAPDGAPVVLYSDTMEKPSQTWIAELGKSGEWRRRGLVEHVGKTLPHWSVSLPGGLAIGKDGRMFVALTARPPRSDGTPLPTGWGPPTNEVLWLESADGGETFNVAMMSKQDPKRANWLPNIEHLTGHHALPPRPGMIYTSGGPGKVNTGIVSNRVYWVG